MGLTELQSELESERELANRALEERAEAIQVMQALAEASRCITESFRMTLKAHNLNMSGHQKAFSRYNKAQKLYEEFCTGTSESD